MRPSQLIGLFLWRAGLLLASSYGLIRLGRLALRYVELPAQIELGAAMMIAGAGLVLGSLVAERVLDARAEEGLRD